MIQRVTAGRAVDCVVMQGFFYNLGRRTGASWRKGRWLWQSVVGTEADAIGAEYDVGKDLAAGVRQEMGAPQDPRAQQLLGEVGPALVSWVKDKRRAFSFELIAGEQPNAFALPGGFIFVTRSILALCQWSRDETAFILSHEMAHVMRRHAIDRIINSSAAGLLMRAAPMSGALSGWLRNVGASVVMSSYSQEQELDADALGARLACAAGFESGAAVRLLARLGELERGRGLDTVSEYFATHPPIDTRIENLRRALAPRGS